ncbi:hypothetical protein XH88_32645 [Bradyrhizobium sp. CCBAU 51627]|nr:hypothetical protein [Bradyrhizobium sp. CCBAU 51627]
MVATRAVHFAATAIVVGDVVFRSVIAAPPPRAEAGVVASRVIPTLRVAWFSLGIAVISAGLWLMLQASSMSGMPFDQASSSDVLSTVINETQFGQVIAVRLGLAICLTVCLAFDTRVIARWPEFAAALAFAGSLAWSGHAGATIGETGYVHVAADALHLIAAAAWIGGLASLILFLRACCRSKAVSLASHVVGRFSIIGLMCVGTLLFTGVINTVILVGSVHALIVTDYGRLLVLKLALFSLMLMFALINRLVLTPRLSSFRNGAVGWLTCNSTAELVLGLIILAVVGILGTMHPAIHS